MSGPDPYIHGHHESVLRSHTWRTLENSAAYLVPHLTAGMRVLDVGSGPGTITVDLAQTVFPGAVLGIDVESSMAQRARSYAQSVHVENVEFATGSGYAIDAPDGFYDIVHAHQVLQHVESPTRMMSEMLRVVKPGGIVAVRDAIYSGSTWYPDSEGLASWLGVYGRAARFAKGDPDIGRRLHAIALSAGASSVTASASIWCFADDPDREWWGTLWADRLIESNLAVNVIESGAAQAHELESIARAWREWAADERGWFAMPHGEIIARK